MIRSREDIVPMLKERLGGAILGIFEKSPKRVFVDVRPEEILRVTTVIFRELGARFQIASGVDVGDGIEILYHWAFDSHFCVVTVKVRLPRDGAVIDSVAGICKGAEWIEREMWELLGITFKNHPDMRHLLLTDDWPAGVYPLRRDFKGLK